MISSTFLLSWRSVYFNEMDSMINSFFFYHSIRARSLLFKCVLRGVLSGSRNYKNDLLCTVCFPLDNLRHLSFMYFLDYTV